VTANAAEAQAPDKSKADGVTENPLTLSWLVRHPLVGAAAVSSAGAGLVHAAAAGTHTSERVAAIIFAVTAALQVAWAFYYLARPGRPAAIVGVVLNGTFAAVWLASRTVGLPAPEALAGVEHVTMQDGIAALLGLIAAACAAVAAWKTELIEHHRAGSIVAACAISVTVVAVSIAGVSASHGHGDMAGHDMTAAASPTTAPADPNAMAGMDHSGMNMGSPASSSQPNSTTMDHSGMSGMDMSGAGGDGMAGMDMSGTTTTTALSLPAGSPLNTTDVGYAQGVLASRQQQLRMAQMAVVNSRNPEVRYLAVSVTADPAPTVTRLEGSLGSVNQPVPTSSVVRDAVGPAPAMMTSGLLSEAEMAKLENSYGPTFDQLYLEMMIRLKDGVIGMSEQAYESGSNGDVRSIARELLAVSSAQRRTIYTFNERLHEQA
jgi:uncharacterized protein (DUF305 family)